jgi:hypothetical protein
MDRQFECLKCKKSFKLKSHLKTHEKTCTGFTNHIKCDECGKNFKSEKTLKQHRDKCKPFKTYNCEECCKTFKTYSEHLKHRLHAHKMVVCDICEKDIHFKNIKRHLKTVHEGFTQAKTALWIQQEETKRKGYKYKCEDCSKYFCDRSTLNRHRKCHSYECKECKNKFQSEGNLKDHMMSHNKANTKHVNTIALTEQISHILDVQKHLEALLFFTHNRGQAITMSDIFGYVEKNMKAAVKEEIIVAIFSLFPEGYSLSLLNQKACVQMISETKSITLKILEARRLNFKEKIRQLHKIDPDMILPLIDLPKVQSKPYVSAKDTIMKHIVQFNDSEESVEEENKIARPKTKYEEIAQKIKNRTAHKNKRDAQFQKIDWQKKRLPDLARAVNAVFNIEQKRVIKLDILLRKLKASSKLESDIQRLINSSNGWLKNHRGWIRKQPDDINFVCKQLCI